MPSLIEAFSVAPSQVYDSSAKPAVDVDLSLCKEDEKPRMIALINRLAKSPSGLETLQIAKEGCFTFSFFDGSTRCCGACDEAGKWIKLNPAKSDSKLVGTLCHEARHAGQFVRGAHEAFGVQDVRSELILFRAMEADAQTYAVFPLMPGLTANSKTPIPKSKGVFQRLWKRRTAKLRMT